jgi:hypothetical protein
MPVYFDRHTLSIKAGQVFGRAHRFELVRTITTSRPQRAPRGSCFRRQDFFLASTSPRALKPSADDGAQSNSTTSTTSAANRQGDLPEYVLAIDDAQCPDPLAPRRRRPSADMSLPPAIAPPAPKTTVRQALMPSDAVHPRRRLPSSVAC